MPQINIIPPSPHATLEWYGYLFLCPIGIPMVLLPYSSLFRKTGTRPATEKIFRYWKVKD